MWSWLSQISPNVAVSAIVAVATYAYHRIAGGRETRIDSVLRQIHALLGQWVRTARPDMSVDTLIGELKGAAAVQLGKAGIDPQNALVKALVGEAIAGAVHTFVELHPSPRSIELPLTRQVAGGPR